MLSRVRAFATTASNVFNCRFCAGCSSAWSQPLLHAVHVEVVVPGVEDLGCRRDRHPLAIAACSGGDRGAALVLREAAIASRDLDARHEPLHIPLERPRMRLVEVVDVEHQPPLGAGEQTEVRQVRVSAQLGLEPAARGPRQVGCHEQGGTAVEREGRHHHAPVADRNEVLYTGGRLLLQQRDRIGPIGRCLPDGVAGARGVHARGPSIGAAAREICRRRWGERGGGRIVGHGVSFSCVAPCEKGAISECSTVCPLGLRGGTPLPSPRRKITRKGCSPGPRRPRARPRGGARLPG